MAVRASLNTLGDLGLDNGERTRRQGLRRVAAYAYRVDLFGFLIVAMVVGAFFALIGWLRSSQGELHPPGEAGDADKWPRLDGS
jgi:hypothetical protein